MRLTPPKRVVFYLSVLFAAAGLIGYFVDLTFLSSNAFFLLAVGYILLFLGNAVKGF
jgi:hypothetical protein